MSQPPLTSYCLVVSTCIALASSSVLFRKIYRTALALFSITLEHEIVRAVHFDCPYPAQQTQSPGEWRIANESVLNRSRAACLMQEPVRPIVLT